MLQITIPTIARYLTFDDLKSLSFSTFWKASCWQAMFSAGKNRLMRVMTAFCRQRMFSVDMDGFRPVNSSFCKKGRPSANKDRFLLEILRHRHNEPHNGSARHFLLEKWSFWHKYTNNASDTTFLSFFAAYCHLLPCSAIFRLFLAEKRFFWQLWNISQANMRL